ncbi:hypothetical protein RRG08_047273 [Elysia crispata]|uniref:Uncharacterized protein n=1 Tax=Elysia crispata TaxID=231223 RepID=A0AAE0ZCN3_9GAST|nr:hypothetical protein RRG08_047273 [Elysia crispata]
MVDRTGSRRPREALWSCHISTRLLWPGNGCSPCLDYLNHDDQQCSIDQQSHPLTWQGLVSISWSSCGCVGWSAGQAMFAQRMRAITGPHQYGGDEQKNIQS